MNDETVIIIICPVLLFTLHNSKNIAYHITEELIPVFYADKIMLMGNSKNMRVFNFEILLESRKSQKFDAREIYVLQYLIRGPTMQKSNTAQCSTLGSHRFIHIHQNTISDTKLRNECHLFIKYFS